MIKSDFKIEVQNIFIKLRFYELEIYPTQKFHGFIFQSFALRKSTPSLINLSHLSWRKSSSPHP